MIHLTRRQREALAIARQIGGDGSPIRTQDLADRMEINKVTAREHLVQLTAKGYINHQYRIGYTLAETEAAIATRRYFDGEITDADSVIRLWAKQEMGI